MQRRMSDREEEKYPADAPEVARADQPYVHVRNLDGCGLPDNGSPATSRPVPGSGWRLEHTLFERQARTKRAIAIGAVACAILIGGAIPRESEAMPAATAPSLGTAASFAVLGGSTVTNTGATVVNGNLGVAPGSAVTGFPPGVVTGGTIHRGDAVARQAQSDVSAAYTALASQPCNSNLTGQDLGGMTLTAGVYCFSTSAQLTGQLTLDGQGDPNAVFIFQIGSTLTTASAASVLLINGASSCNVFWQVGSSATLGTGTAFAGSILALTSNTLTTAASVNGRVLAQNGAVTMDTNRVSSSACSALTTSAPSSTATAGSTVTPTSTTAPAAATATAAAAAATSTALAATAVAATGTASAGGMTATPVPTGVPLSASPVVTRLTIHRQHGVAHIRWYSVARVRGFNVYDNGTRLNRHRVVSQTRWYHFSTRHAVNRLVILAIPRR
jgi:hypothetical protein